MKYRTSKELCTNECSKLQQSEGKCLRCAKSPQQLKEGILSLRSAHANKLCTYVTVMCLRPNVPQLLNNSVRTVCTIVCSWSPILKIWGALLMLVFYGRAIGWWHCYELKYLFYTFLHTHTDAQIPHVPEDWILKQGSKSWSSSQTASYYCYNTHLLNVYNLCALSCKHWPISSASFEC